MTIQSMTGFGSAESSHDGWAMKVECRSVNHRGLDVRVWAPRDWAWVEPFVLEVVRDRLARGRVEVRVDVAPHDESMHAVAIDASVFAAVATRLREAASASGLAAPTVGDVMLFEEVRSSAAEHQPPEDTAGFQQTIRDAIASLIDARAAEGERLLGTMVGLVDEVEHAVLGIDTLAPDVANEYRTRLEQRVAEALERFGAGEIDERSVLHEVALYADKSDVSEELQRAKSHIEKLREVFARDTVEPTGKQVDFYLQELFREANTTGSKSGSLAITDHIIAMKTAIERMREQAANIE